MHMYVALPHLCLCLSVRVTQVSQDVQVVADLYCILPIKWPCSSLFRGVKSFIAFKNSGYLNTRCITN